MFPDFQYLFQYLFNVDIPALSLIKTFGFFVALGFLVGAWIIFKELKRKAEEGKFQAEIVEEVVGKPASQRELLSMGILGFVLGFKVVGLIMNASVVSQDPISFLFSTQGNLLAGIIGAAIFAYSRYSEKKKLQKNRPTVVKHKMYPHHRVSDIIFIAAITGFAGAKIFNAFETWDSFIQNPLESLLAPSGLTFYGGLIVATLALYIYSKRKKFSFAQLCDAAAPALILAYGIGRLGCQFSGDGDWGIYNSAYITQADGSLVAGSLQDYENMVSLHPQAFKEFGEVPTIPHKYVPAKWGLPTWMFAQNFKHNVNNDGIPIEGYSGNYSHVLPVAVFPTAMYEAVLCFFLFLFLWAIRKKLHYPLQIFGVYLIINGLERFLIEKIRVNYQYNLGFMRITQAEIISFGLIIAGCILLIYIWKNKDRKLLDS